MTTLKINERIAFLRKEKGLTQEELAKALGVTNQAVSKWESSQCCPDIQLLPYIADFFNISLDELFNRKQISPLYDIIASLRKKIESLDKGDDFDFVFRIAAALHTIIWSKEMGFLSSENQNPDIDDLIEHAGNTEWGYSCYSIPEIITTMRHGAVFFSNNKNLTLMDHNIKLIVSIVKPFSNVRNLKIATALYQLTASSESAYADVIQICDMTGIPSEKIENVLAEDLAPFIIEKNGVDCGFRFKGMYMNIIPIISMLDLG